LFIISINYIFSIKLVSIDFKRMNNKMSLELAQIKSQAQDDTSKAGIEEFEKRLLDMLSKN